MSRPIISASDTDPSLSLFLSTIADAGGYSQGHGSAWQVNIPIHPLRLDSRTDAENCLGVIHRVRVQKTTGVNVFLDLNSTLKNPSDARKNVEEDLSLIVVIAPYLQPIAQMKVEVFGSQPAVEFVSPTAPPNPQIVPSGYATDGVIRIKDRSGGEVICRSTRLPFLSPAPQEVVSESQNINFPAAGFYEIGVSFPGGFEGADFSPALTFSYPANARAFELPAARSNNATKFLVKIEAAGTFGVALHAKGRSYSGDNSVPVKATFSQPQKLV